MASTYPTFQDLKLYLGINTDKNDAILVKTLKRAISTFENMCGRSFIPKAEVRFYDANGEEVISHKRLFIRSGDLISVSELKIDNEIVPSSEYFFTDAIPHFALSLKASSDFSFKYYSTTPERTISITGSWGYQDEVPDDVFGAIVRLASWLYQQKDNAMELDRPIAMSNAMILPSSLPADVEGISMFYKKVI